VSSVKESIESLTSNAVSLCYLPKFEVPTVVTGQQIVRDFSQLSVS
jgi:hypothetical protein